MTIRIDGGVVVGWSGKYHDLIPDGTVLIDGDTITYVWTDQSRPADQVIDARGKVICPGFINLHVHSQLNVGDYLLTEVTKDETDLYNRAEGVANKAWDNWANRDWAGRRTEEIIPPAFPARAG